MSLVHDGKCEDEPEHSHPLRGGDGEYDDGTSPLSVCCGLCFRIASVVLAIIAYVEWSKHSDEYGRISDNWTLKPIVDVAAVSVSSNCASGYNAIGFGKLKTQLVKCEEDDVEYDFYCDTPTSTRSGTEKNTTSDLSFYAWRGSKICIRRAGVNAKDRPTEQTSGYKSCGQTADSGTLWFDSTENCPMVGLSKTSGASPQTILTLADGTTFYFQRSSLNSTNVPLPILEFETGEGGYCKKTGKNLFQKDSGDTYDFDGVRNNSVYGGKAKATSSSSAVSGSKCSFRIFGICTTNENPYSTLHPTFGHCNGLDSRYEQIDTLNEETFYDGNWGDSVDSSSYIYASDSGSSTVKWSFHSRNEILWKESCSYSREQAYNVGTIVNGIETCMVVTLICGIIEFIIKLILVYQGFKNGEFANTIYLIVTTCCSTATFIPTVVTFTLLQASVAFFHAVLDEKCSDPTTNETFDYLGEEVVTQWGYYIAILVFCSLNLLYNFIQCCMLVCPGGVSI